MGSLDSIRSRGTALLLLGVVVLATLPGVAAAETRTGGTIVVEEGETVDGLTAFGGTVVVRGTVDGDLEAFAGNVEIAEGGEVTGDVEVAAGNLVVGGRVGGDVSGAAGAVTVAPSAELAGSLQAGGGDVTLDGTVRGDVEVGAERFTVGPNAVVEGDVAYDAGTFTRADGAQIAGTVSAEENVGIHVTGPVVPAVTVPAWVGAVYELVVHLLLGAVLLAVLPGFSARVAARADGPGEAVRAGLVGFGALIGVPILLVLLALTIVGIPITLLGAVLFALALWIGYVYGAFALGSALLSAAGVGRATADAEGPPGTRGSDRTTNRWLALAVGVPLVVVLSLVPIVGGLIDFLVLLVGFGALLWALWDLRGDRGETTATAA